MSLSSTKFKIRIEDREYKKYSFSNAITLNPEIPKEDICPVKNKLFNHDVIECCDKKINIVHSSIRHMTTIPGVLVLENNKRYGKHKQKFLYKCIPDDKRMPEFLVPYSSKSSFNKNKSNLYIVFKYISWDHKHPRGQIVQILGEVNNLSNFYEYQLYCKSLYASIQNFNKRTIGALREKTQEEFIDIMINKFKPENRLDRDIITIDSKRSTDFDDAIGVIYKDDVIIFSVYISNVAIWLDTLSLWDSFSQRIATIYLPDRKRPMLPTVLSEGLCSLNENTIRFAITLDIHINKDTFEIIDYEFKNTYIRVSQNLRYEDREKLYQNKMYSEIFSTVKNLNKCQNKTQRYTDHINSSHDVIAYAMILMNYYSAKEFQKHKMGIFRTSHIKRDVSYPDNISKDIKKFLTIWNSSGGSYCKYETFGTHEILELDAYMHITSPIRRLVDLMGIIKLCSIMNLCDLDNGAKDFYKKWATDESINYINRTMRSIRKVQNDCTLLKACCQDEIDMNIEYDGYIFDKIQRNDSLYQYMVYLPKLKLTNRITSRVDRDNMTMQKFNLYIFLDEVRMKKKIRLAFVE